MDLKPQNIAGILLLIAAAGAVLYGLYIRTPEQILETVAMPSSGRGQLPQTPTRMSVTTPVAVNVAMAPQRGVDLPVQPDPPATDVAPNFISPRTKIYEAHWQGMDTMEFTDEVRKKLKYSKGFNGILVGEVTMNAARSGLLGGDVVTAVQGVPINSLAEFQRQTKVLRNQRKATITAMRKGKRMKNGRYVMKRRSFTLQADDFLGFAQVEAAPMIVAGDPPPHPYRGPCTDCHAIGEGWELAPDPDLINLPPPIISQATVAQGVYPHRDFGPCQACHVIVP